MSDISTDFIKATNKIYAKVAAILTNLQVIEGDVKLIREQTTNNASESPSGVDADNTQDRPRAANQSSRDKDHGKGGNGSGSHLRKRWKKNLRKPIIQIEIAALIGLGLYTCETRRTNNLTKEALEFQFSMFRSQQRAYIQISGDELEKVKLTDLQRLSIPIELRNTGREYAEKISGEFVLEVLPSNMEPLFDYGQTPVYVVVAPMPPNSTHSIDAQILKDGYVMAVSDELKEELSIGKKYIVIFGRVKYEDRFGDWWAQFCGWRPFLPPDSGTKGFAARRCVEYNIQGRLEENTIAQSRQLRICGDCKVRQT
jgi:hypothetical protein